MLQCSTLFGESFSLSICHPLSLMSMIFCRMSSCITYCYIVLAVPSVCLFKVSKRKDMSSDSGGTVTELKSKTVFFPIPWKTETAVFLSCWMVGLHWIWFGKALNLVRPGRCEKLTTVTTNVYCTLIKCDGHRLLCNNVSISRRPEWTSQLGLPHAAYQ